MLILVGAAGVMGLLLLGEAASVSSENESAAIARDFGSIADAAPDAGPLDASADASDAAADAEVDAGPPPPPTWRVSSLASDPTVEVVQGELGKRPLLAALGNAGVSRAEGSKIVKAFTGVRDFDQSSPKDTFAVARDKQNGRVVAFEYATSPFDVWQARLDDSGALVGKRLALHVEKKRVAVAVAVGDDLRASIVQAGLDDDVLKMLDDALDGHAELTDLRPGARLRILATEDRVDGVFAQYEELDAVEYTPVSSTGASPLRVYYFGHEPTTTWLARSSKAKDTDRGGFYYDAKGRQPFHGGWRTPIPFARIASRFNPKRMHPVLHVVMPHNGVDFAASPGTPVYAAAEGTVKSVGSGGPCGNMVQLFHSSGYVTAYCHLSRFAPGLHVGEHVDGRQLVGYSGATGRVTGPHLHFAVKRGDRFIDPLALKLDGVRVVPLADRAEFDRERAELDLGLDAIALPDAVATDGGAPQEAPDAGTDDNPELEDPTP